MKRRTKHDIAPSGFEIRVGYVTPFVVYDGEQPIAAFHSLTAAKSYFPSAKVSDGAERKARELGE